MERETEWFKETRLARIGRAAATSVSPAGRRPEKLSKLAVACFRQGLKEEAQEILDILRGAVATQTEQLPLLHLTLADSYFQCGRFSEAYDECKAVEALLLVESSGASNNVVTMLAVFWMRLGSLEKARNACNRLHQDLSKSSQLEQDLNTRARAVLQALLGDLEASERIMKTLPKRLVPNTLEGILLYTRSLSLAPSSYVFHWIERLGSDYETTIGLLMVLYAESKNPTEVLRLEKALALVDLKGHPLDSIEGHAAALVALQMVQQGEKADLLESQIVPRLMHINFSDLSLLAREYLARSMTIADRTDLAFGAAKSAEIEGFPEIKGEIISQYIRDGDHAKAFEIVGSSDPKFKADGILSCVFELLANPEILKTTDITELEILGSEVSGRPQI